MQRVLLLILVLVVALVGAQLPDGCECPLDCVCSVQDGSIDCTDAELRFVPVEINSCAWPGITKLDLSGNQIGRVHDYAFSQLASVTHLYLFDNQIAELGVNAFVGLESLEVLFLDGNRIDTLSHRVFRSLKKLKRLLLYSNLLTTLPYGIFSSLSSLTQLALYDNRLDGLKTEVFDDTPALEELYLHRNLITDLSNAPFRSLVNLRLLYLNDNRLTTISRFSFLGLSKLTLLILSRNSITTIENDTFNPTQKLQHLYLENNKLREINRLMFAGPTNLLNLHLYDNEIERISNGAFYRLTKLERLSIHTNAITEIKKETFVGMDSLTELVLNNNRLTNLTKDSFAQLTKLERLWLYSNRIACMEPGSFKGLQNLRILQLAINRISDIPNDLFQDTLNLTYLFLYDNDITSIGNTPFRNLPKLIQLSIYYNSIEYMAAGALEGSDKLYYLQWSDFGNSHHLSSVVCGEPEQHAGQDIRGLQRASFGCSGAVLSVDVGPDCDDHIVPQGGCLRLTCSSSPRGPVTWSRLDGAEIRSRPNTCSSSSPQSQCSLSGGGDGVLIVENVMAEDAGYYLCTSEFNNMTRSQICHVIIGEPPTINRKPADVFLASPGPAVTFSLSYSGTPQPTIKWYKNTTSGSEILLSEEGPQSRYIVSDQGTLVIMQTVLEDQGTYRAVITNRAGETSIESQLSFYYDSHCRRSCLNGGRCVQVPMCLCTDDYVGRQCEEYIGTDTEEPPTTVSTDTEPPTTNTPIPPATTPTTVAMTTDEAITTGSGSGSGNYPDDESFTTDDETEGPTSDYEETSLDYDSSSDNETSGDGLGDDDYDMGGLIDDEDYADQKKPEEVGGANQRRRKRYLDQRLPQNNFVERAGNQAEENQQVNELDMRQRNLKRVFGGDRRKSDSVRFQAVVRQIVNENVLFKQRMDEDVKLSKFAQDQKNSNQKSYSESISQHTISQEVESARDINQLRESRDVYGQPIHYEYRDTFDPYELIPGSK